MVEFGIIDTQLPSNNDNLSACGKKDILAYSLGACCKIGENRGCKWLIVGDMHLSAAEAKDILKDHLPKQGLTCPWNDPRNQHGDIENSRGSFNASTVALALSCTTASTGLAHPQKKHVVVAPITKLQRLHCHSWCGLQSGWQLFFVFFCTNFTKSVIIRSCA